MCQEIFLGIAQQAQASYKIKLPLSLPLSGTQLEVHCVFKQDDNVNYEVARIWKRICPVLNFYPAVVMDRGNYEKKMSIWIASIQVENKT
jgi:hypothetical protein